MIQRFRRDRRGTAAIEFCFVAPVMLLLYAGITEFGSILKAYYQTNRLASQYAAAWSDCSDYPQGTCNTELAAYATTSAFANIAPALTASSVTLQMFHFKMTGTNPDTPLYAYPSGSTMTVAQKTAARNAGIPSGEYGVLVTVKYTHAYTFFDTLMSQYLATKLSPTYTVVALKS